jgi:hypothetical protein
MKVTIIISYVLPYKSPGFLMQHNIMPRKKPTPHKMVAGGVVHNIPRNTAGFISLLEAMSLK